MLKKVFKSPFFWITMVMTILALVHEWLPEGLLSTLGEAWSFALCCIGSCVLVFILICALVCMIYITIQLIRKDFGRLHIRRYDKNFDDYNFFDEFVDDDNGGEDSDDDDEVQDH